MSNSTRTVTGVAEPCALPPVDKWQILDALSAAAEEFELNHRTLSVLRALITFLPAREITAELNSCIVFPSNRTLSERLHGMPESTLRRGCFFDLAAPAMGLDRRRSSGVEPTTGSASRPPFPPGDKSQASSRLPLDLIMPRHS